jgi:Uncharacterized protein conserved in bacteria (DUF2213)
LASVAIDTVYYERLSPNQELTHEGYLICRNVPLARTGTMIYGPHELRNEDGGFLDAGPDGFIYVDRPEDEIFNDYTMKSLEGKPVTIHHPAVIGNLANPDNWKDLSVGFVMNVRRSPDNPTLLIGDLVITDRSAIEHVRNKRLREVSMGYTAHYDQEDAGFAIQRNIQANHLALVQQGRCGPLCAIGDSMMEVEMTRKARLLKAFRTRDEAGFMRALEDDDKFDKEGKDKVPKKSSPDDNLPDRGESKSNNAEVHHHHVTVNVHGEHAHNNALPNGGEAESTGSPDEGGVTEEGVPPGGAAKGIEETGTGRHGGAENPLDLILALIRKIDARLTAVEKQLSGSQSVQGVRDWGGASNPAREKGIAVQHKDQAPRGETPPQSGAGASGPPDGDLLNRSAKAMAGAPVVGEKSADTEDSPDTEKTYATDDPLTPAKPDHPGHFVEPDTPQGAAGPELEKNMAVADGTIETPEGSEPPELSKNHDLKTTSPDTFETQPNNTNITRDPMLKGKITRDPAIQSPTRDSAIRNSRMPEAHDLSAIRLREEWSETISQAELLMPGIRLPTFDAQLDDTQTRRALCDFRRKVLNASWETDKGLQIIRNVVTTDAPDFKGMTCDAIDVVFANAARRMRETNNILSIDRGASGARQEQAKVPKTPAELNAFYRDYYENQAKRGY